MQILVTIRKNAKKYAKCVIGGMSKWKKYILIIVK